MLLRVPPGPAQDHYCSDAELNEKKKPKRGRRLRNTSPSPTRFLRVRVGRNEDATDHGQRPQTVKRSRSYHDIEQATSPTADSDGGILTMSMSSAAAVPSNSSGTLGSSIDAKHLLVEEARGRKTSGGSHKLNDMFSLGLRFGGKGNKEKKKKDKKQVGELPSPAANPPSGSDDELTVYSIPPETLREWRKSLDVVLQDPAGRVLFQRHLRLEHSMENMQFCKEVDRFKTLPDSKLEKESRTIAAKYVGEGTPKQLNIDASVVKKVEEQLKAPHRDMFDEARQTAYELMAQDTFRRFKTSADYIKASQRDLQNPQLHVIPPT